MREIIISMKYFKKCKKICLRMQANNKYYLKTIINKIDRSICSRDSIKTKKYL